MSSPIPPSYKTKDWPAYNEALKQRASLTVCFDPDMAWVVSKHPARDVVTQR